MLEDKIKPAHQFHPSSTMSYYDLRRAHFRTMKKNTNVRVRGERQQAIVAFTEERASAAPEVASDEHVAEESMGAVKQRWSTADPAGMTVVRAMVYSVTRQVRRGGAPEDGDTAIIASFEQQEIVDFHQPTTQSAGSPV